MILPVGAKKFEEALQMGAETYHHLKVNPPKTKMSSNFVLYLVDFLFYKNAHLYDENLIVLCFSNHTLQF